MFTLISTIIFFLLGLIWNKSSWLNIFLKVLFFGMGAWGVVTLFHLRVLVR